MIVLVSIPPCPKVFRKYWVKKKFPNNKQEIYNDKYRHTRDRLFGLMERMINARLVWFLESNGLFSTIQCGFRQGRSTLDHLVRFVTFILNAFAKKEHAVLIFFDLEKAYDTTWKYGILKDLFDMGLKGKVPTFISNFLSDREFNLL